MRHKKPFTQLDFKRFTRLMSKVNKGSALERTYWDMKREKFIKEVGQEKYDLMRAAPKGRTR